MTILKYVLYLLGGVIAVILIWGLVEPYFLDVQEETVEIPHLPPAWEGKRVAQVSDFQVGMWLDNTGTVRQAMERIVEEKPAVALITGDFIYHAVGDKESQISKVMTLMEPLIRSDIPTFAVLGNHDYSVSNERGEPILWEGEMLRDSLEAAGIRVLQNESVALPSPGAVFDSSSDTTGGGQLYLAGVGPHWPDLSSPVETVQSVPNDAARLVMLHHPDSFADLPPQSAPLAVAGHTHGGQVRIPFLPEWSWVTYVKEEEVHTDGWIQDYGARGNRLYVNRGIGFSAAPLRINCPPELTLFTLQGSTRQERASGDDG